jgi:hypothetical protein
MVVSPWASTAAQLFLFQPALVEQFTQDVRQSRAAGIVLVIDFFMASCQVLLQIPQFPKAAPYETDLLGDTHCCVEIESNAKRILVWHLEVAAHTMRGSLRRSCACHAVCRQNNWFRACIFHQLPS